MIKEYIYVLFDVKCQLLFDYVNEIGLGLNSPISHSEKIFRRFSFHFVNTERLTDGATSVLICWSTTCCGCGSFKNKSLTVR